MRGHQVRDEELVFPQFFIQLFIFFTEFLIHGVFRFAHTGQDRIGNMLRGNLQLPADMVVYQLPEKGVVLIRQQIIKAYAGTDKDLFHTGKGTQASQQLQVILMIRFQVRTGLREKALPHLAYALGQLLITGRRPEIGCGSSHIMNIAFEFRILTDQLRFLQNGFMAPYLYGTSLVKSQCTEVTAAEASPVADQGKLDFTDCRDAAFFLVGGMVGPPIRKGVNVIHLFHGKRCLGRVLHHILPSRIPFRKGFSVKGIGIGILHHKAFRIFFLICLHLFVGRQNMIIIKAGYIFRFINRPGDKGEILYCDSAV